MILTAPARTAIQVVQAVQGHLLIARLVLKDILTATVKHAPNALIDVCSALNLVCVAAAPKGFFSSQVSVFARAQADILM